MTPLEKLMRRLVDAGHNAYSVSRPPPPGVAPSMAPGTGPAQEREHANSPQDASYEAPSVPKPNWADARRATGFGGGGDPVVIVPAPRAGRTSRTAGQNLGAGPLDRSYVTLYGQLRSREDWRFTVEDYAQVAITQAVANGTATGLLTVVSNNNAIGNNMRLSQYPGAISAYRVLVYLSLAPTALTATGAYALTLQPYSGGSAAGKIVPLGVFTASQAFSEVLSLVVDVPITDAGDIVVGQVTMTSITIAAPTTVTIQLGVGYAYPVPEHRSSGYHVEPSLGNTGYDK